jgi:hypothetical protein
MKYKAFLYFNLQSPRQNLPGKLQALPLCSGRFSFVAMLLRKTADAFSRIAPGAAYGSPSCR